MNPKLFTKNLNPGDVGVDVFALQRLLQSMGYGVFVPTGYYGTKTTEQVKSYQLNNKITATGTLGPVTRNSMNSYITNQKSEILYKSALRFIGVDASPSDLADDEYGCADTICSILRNTFGSSMGIPYTVSTNTMYKSLKYSLGYEQINKPQKGCIIISPTGYGNGGLSNGHVGIVGENNTIMSNNSYTGNFESNYTIDTWKARYVDIGGYPMYYFKKI